MREFIDDSLSRSMVAGSKFKVLNSVVGSVAINVMDRLFGIKLSPKVLFHDHAMLKHELALSARNRRRNADVSISPLDMTGVFAGLKLLTGLFDLSLNFTGVTTKRMLSSVHYAPTMDVLFSLCGRSTLLANKGRVLLGEKLLRFSGAFSRAEHGVLSPFLAVRSHVGLHHGEFRPTLLARKDHGSFPCGGPAIVALADAKTFHAAKLGRGLGWFDSKWGAAGFAILLNRHDVSFHVGA